MMENPVETYETIQRLKHGLEILQEGGAAPWVCEPHWLTRVFRDSVNCPNVGLDFRVEPCHCYLVQFVPPEYHQEENPCRFIPLNEKGDTVASLSESGNYDLLYDCLCSWVERTLTQLTRASRKSGWQ